ATPLKKRTQSGATTYSGSSLEGLGTPESVPKSPVPAAAHYYHGLLGEGSMARVAIIMPGRNKHFYIDDTSFGREWEPFYDFLWDRAREALRNADEIVI
ncbi:MAG TPA: hypothetical protein VGW37_04135, partial [Terriglobia bacterium]|nr:hypothetical protein [Terriglobia bacterium]